MFYFFRGKDRPTHPREEALNTFHRLIRMKGITQRPPLADVWDIFCDFSAIPFIAEQDELLFIKQGEWVMLQRRFKTEQGFGLLVAQLHYATERTEDMEIVSDCSERKTFIKQVERSETFKRYRHQFPLDFQVDYHQ